MNEATIDERGMMNEATRLFALAHADDDVRRLALAGCRDAEVDLTAALQQIQGRQTARQKLPSWAALDAIIYPPHLNMEQCSSEQTARYKAAVCRRLLALMALLESRPHQEDSPLCPAVFPPQKAVCPAVSPPEKSSLLDLTGGFGVDFAFMSEAFDEAVYVERDPVLFAIASANMRLLAPHARCINDDGLAVLHTHPSPATLIYLDPARRDAHGDRTYGIGDCTPNVLEIKDELLDKADLVMLKLSPMLDWRKAVSDLGEQHVKEVHIVSVHNECKELLIIMRKELETSLMGAEETTPRLYCVNDDDCFVVPLRPTPFHSVPQHPLRPTLSHLVPIRPTPSHHLFEPNASIMKAGCFEAIEQSFGVHQLSPNSHLFVSEERKEHFPGRAFYIKAITSMNKKDLKDALQGITHANLTVRNFPLSVPELRKKLKLADGGNTYIFATTLADGSRVLLICEKRL